MQNGYHLNKRYLFPSLCGAFSSRPICFPKVPFKAVGGAFWAGQRKKERLKINWMTSVPRQAPDVPQSSQRNDPYFFAKSFYHLSHNTL